MPFAPSELVLNDDGSVYHLGLHPHEISDTIFLVGDPSRVERVSAQFDSIELKRQRREFITHTGTRNGKRLTVLATGIGTDNIDIVINELDALANINLESRTIKSEHTPLRLIRMGTSGSLQSDIPVDSILLSEAALGLDGLLHFYESDSILDREFSEAFRSYTKWPIAAAHPYVVNGNKELISHLSGTNTFQGTTITAHGFYGPQGRALRIPLGMPELNDQIEKFRFNNRKITNYEMETSALYGLGALLGHKCATACVVIANRPNNTFSADHHTAVDRMIHHILGRVDLMK